MTTALESRVQELEEAKTSNQARAEELIQSEGVKIERKDGQVYMEIDPSLMEQVKSLHAQNGEIDLLIGATKQGSTLTQFKGMQEEMSAAMRAAAGGDLAANLSTEMKSLGEMFVQSDIFQQFKSTGRGTMDTPFTMDINDLTSLGNFDGANGGFGQKDVFTSLLTGAVNPRGFGRVQFDPSVPRAQRTTRVRDLFPVATTNANLIDYFRVLGFAENNGDGNAGPVRERAAADGVSAPSNPATDTFGLKPRSNLRFESAQAPVRTLAHWEAAHRNVLVDEPQLQSTINNELLYGLALEEDWQILNGDGTGENLLGLLHTDDTQSYTQSGGEPKSDALRRAATKAIIANYAPTGYVLHPYDWEEVELQKDDMGRYMLVTNVAVGAETRVWRQPVVETPAMTEGTFVTGAWGIGAQLYDRQNANVRIAEQHADFFVRNAVAILVEERLAFAVKRPESFVIGTFA